MGHGFGLGPGEAGGSARGEGQLGVERCCEGDGCERRGGERHVSWWEVRFEKGSMLGWEVEGISWGGHLEGGFEGIDKVGLV
jgi:hypothetical protein